MSTLTSNISPEIAPLTPYGETRSTIAGKPLGDDELRDTNVYWRACNYLSLGMIYLFDNALLTEPLRPEHIKNRLLGHWGSSPGLSFIYVHLNRLIKKYDLDMIFLAGPGARRSGRSRSCLSRRNLFRGVSGKEPGPGGAEGILPAVFFSGRHRQPLHSRNAGIDS
jgi:hypothetical protein